MARILHGIVFRHTLLYVGIFVVSLFVVFGVLYWSTLQVYEQRANDAIEAEARAMERDFAGLGIPEVALIITQRCNDEPGEWDHYILVSANYEYIAGNILEWPQGLDDSIGLTDVALGRDANGEPELHRVRTVVLPSGHRVLVGRNLTELMKLRGLIGRALLRTLALTLVLGVGGGFIVSRIVASRLNRINVNSIAILQGDISRRMPVLGTGDEVDELCENLNRMLDRIESLMQRTRRVTDDIAHDMRKPISRMRSRIEVALMTPRDAEAYREVLERTIEETDEILTVFNALLTIATTESGTPRDHFEEVDLAEIVQSAAEIYEPAFEDAGLSLEVAVDGPAELSGNPHLITQALANLLDNAIKYARGSGAVAVRTVVTDKIARLIVADRGRGIPEDFRDRALDRFTRLDESRTTTGSGLGLSLVRAVAQLHGGSVELGDNRPGLKVTMSFPLPPRGA